MPPKIDSQAVLLHLFNMQEGELPATDANLRMFWRAAGGEFHGPHVETGTMPETALLALLRLMIETANYANPDSDDEYEQATRQ